MIQYKDNARDYIERTRKANQYLVRSHFERQTSKRKLNLVNIGLLIVLVGLLTVLAIYLPYAMDQTWEQQYVEPMKYINSIQD